MMPIAATTDRANGHAPRHRTGRAAIPSRADGHVFIAACALLMLAFALGGASRGDVPTLIILRPIAILLLGVGLWGLTWRHLRDHRYLFGIAAAMLVLPLIQLVPLPASLWSRLPGREIVGQIDAVAGLGALWRPMSMTPAGTVNAFLALLVPLGVLVLGARLGGDRRRMLLPLAIVLGMASGLLALLQILGPPDGSLYLYRVTNAGSAVGLFANRNHQAVLLATMFPMLAVFASLSWRRLGRQTSVVLAIGFGAILVPLILITGSRIGLVTGVIGLTSCVLLYRPECALRDGRSGVVDPARSGPGRRRLSIRPAHAWLLAGTILALVAVLGVLSVGQGRGEAVQRMLAPDTMGDMRFKSWGEIARIAGGYFPFGSGAGSFVEIFQLHEPRRLLDTTYLNHAHNDWLEVVLTDGLPALILLAVAAGATVVRALRLARRAGQAMDESVLFARLGLVLVVQFAIASIGDYPLRTPALACLFALAALWAATPLRRSGDMTGIVAGDRSAAEI